jgi:hypothetical protein
VAGESRVVAGVLLLLLGFFLLLNWFFLPFGLLVLVLAVVLFVSGASASGDEQRWRERQAQTHMLWHHQMQVAAQQPYRTPPTHPPPPPGHLPPMPSYLPSASGYAPPPPPPPPPAPAPSEAGGFCPFCGARIGAGHSFCQRCGRPVPAPSA